MDHEKSSGDLSGIRVDVGLEFHKIIDYDRRAMRRALLKGAADVRKEARRLVARRAISAAGEFPGRETGTLARAIGILKKGSGDGWVKVGVRSIPGGFFYPAILFYGSSKMNIAKRGNYMTAALGARRDAVRRMIREALRNALVPR